MGKNNSINKKIESLTSERLTSVIYFLALKTIPQKKCITDIYNKDISKICQAPFLQAKKQLIKAELLEKKVINGKFYLQSNIDPFIDYVLQKQAERGRKSPKDPYHILEEKEADVLKTILNSKWFRSFFSPDNQKKGYPFDYFPERRPDGRMDEINTMETIASILDVLATMNDTFSLEPAIRKKMPSIIDIKGDFDSFADNWVSKNFGPEFERWMKKVIRGSKWYLGEVPKNLVNMATGCHFLCIPPSLAHKVSSINRSEFTLFKALAGSMQANLHGKKVIF